MKNKDNYLNKKFKNYREETEKQQKQIVFSKRFRGYNPDQMSFIHFNPVKAFPKGTFERFIVKGLKKVNIYWSMICTCYNMKRIYNLIKTG